MDNIDHRAGKQGHSALVHDVSEERDPLQGLRIPCIGNPVHDDIVPGSLCDAKFDLLLLKKEFVFPGTGFLKKFYIEDKCQPVFLIRLQAPLHRNEIGLSMLQDTGLLPGFESDLHAVVIFSLPEGNEERILLRLERNRADPVSKVIVKDLHNKREEPDELLLQHICLPIDSIAEGFRGYSDPAPGDTASVPLSPASAEDDRIFPASALEMPDLIFKAQICCRILRKRLIRRLVGFAPEPSHNIRKVAHLGKLAVACEDHKDDPVIRADDHILTEHPVVGKASFPLIKPDLVSVPEGVIVDLLPRRLYDPVGRNDLLPLPTSQVKIELPELRGILRLQEHAPSALCIPLGRCFPEDLVDPERVKKPRLQILKKRFSRPLRNDR